METFFLMGLGIIICLVVLGIAQRIGNDCGDIFFDGFYGNTSIGDNLRKKEQSKKN